MANAVGLDRQARVSSSLDRAQARLPPNCGSDVVLMWMSESSQAAPLDLRHPQSGPRPTVGDNRRPRTCGARNRNSRRSS